MSQLSQQDLLATNCLTHSLQSAASSLDVDIENVVL